MGGEFVTGLIPEVPIFFLFLFFLCEATRRLQAFHLSEVQGNRRETYNRNVVKKTKRKDKFHLPSSMDMKILQNEDLCYFKELWD